MPTSSSALLYSFTGAGRGATVGLGLATGAGCLTGLSVVDGFD
ncbi:outer membrane lipoprotein [Yersinia frederiksenii ATCC 33641]|nr:outer membrane lipoprotein [Yersinia frederiksenii ATCC 33641]